MRVLDVGCGPGRHAYALAERGISVHGFDPPTAETAEFLLLATRQG